VEGRFEGLSLTTDHLVCRCRRPPLGAGRRHRSFRGGILEGVTEIRSDNIGFVFQNFRLIPTLSAQEKHENTARKKKTGARREVRRAGFRHCLVTAESSSSCLLSG